MKKRKKARRAGSARSQYSPFACANISPDGMVLDSKKRRKAQWQVTTTGPEGLRLIMG